MLLEFIDILKIFFLTLKACIQKIIYLNLKRIHNKIEIAFN